MRVWTSISVQWDSPTVLEWWSDLFSCPLSLAGISKDYCLLISKGSSGYLQVLDKSALPFFHIFPSYLLLFLLFKYAGPTAEKPRNKGSALPQKCCQDYKRLSAVMSCLSCLVRHVYCSKGTWLSICTATDLILYEVHRQITNSTTAACC